IPAEVSVGALVAETSDAAVAETPPESVAAEPEEIEIVAIAPETEATPEPIAAAVEEIVEPEQAEIPLQSETAPEEPIAETVVAALEPEPVAEEIPTRQAELPVEQEATGTSPPSEAELEWARIDAALDISRENEAPAALPEEDAAEMHFDLAGVIIDGSSIYSQRDLLPIYRRYLGNEVSVNDLYKISQAITARYVADGYAETSAVVPTQLIRSGIVTIRVQEGFIGNIIIVD
ncbi:MAG: POTRA domain-containing protein, partial [Alphaproteobacteria bacterium]